MKKLLLMLCGFVSILFSNAQGFGINTTCTAADGSTMPDVSTANRVATVTNAGR